MVDSSLQIPNTPEAWAKIIFTAAFVLLLLLEVLFPSVAAPGPGACIYSPIWP